MRKRHDDTLGQFRYHELRRIVIHTGVFRLRKSWETSHENIVLNANIFIRVVLIRGEKLNSKEY